MSFRNSTQYVDDHRRSLTCPADNFLDLYVHVYGHLDESITDEARTTFFSSRFVAVRRCQAGAGGSSDKQERAAYRNDTACSFVGSHQYGFVELALPILRQTT